MNRGARNTPEWFAGGGLSNYATPDSERRTGKKKHRRSKSDTSYQKSQSRKSAERKEKRKSKDHSRVKSRDLSAVSEYLNAPEHLDVSQHSLPGEQKWMYSSLDNIVTDMTSESQGLRSKHRRNQTVPSPEKKKSPGFLERMFGFGRSDHHQSPDTISSLQLHVHNKVEEKFDPEEKRLLNPPPSPNEQQQQQQRHILNNNMPLQQKSHPMNQHQHMRLYSYQQQKQHKSYQQPVSNNLLSRSAHADHGVESDDLLSYSDDDTAASYLLNQQNEQLGQLYPAYLSDEDLRNHETFQLMQQQRMISLSQNQPQRNPQQMTARYGSVGAGNTMDLLPPLNNQQLMMDNRQRRRSSFYRNAVSSSASNDMYLSEDET